jgi:hypothetical protein
LPWVVFGPVDFFAFARLAAIFCADDLFVSPARLDADSMPAGYVTARLTKF